jgi:AcrR family transcriptional regulator
LFLSKMQMNDVGLRARKMARTRGQIADAAMKLFVEQGYDATTLEEIAERAEIHKRTLLRYFPTKAHLVLHSQYASIEEFRDTMQGRGDRLTVDVWEEHVVRHARSLARRGPYANLRKVARSEPALEGAYLTIQAQYQALLQAGLQADLAGRKDGAIVAHVAAAALAGGNYAVGAMILAREAYDELEAAEVKVIRLVRDGLLAG